MKITHLLAAGLMAAGIGMSGAASAQMNNGSVPPRGAMPADQRGGDMRDHRDRRDDRADMRDHQDRRWDRRTERHSYARNDRHGWNGRQHCRTEWRHHRRVRVCHR
jgi:hypothetical protein